MRPDIKVNKTIKSPVRFCLCLALCPAHLKGSLGDPAIISITQKKSMDIDGR